MAIPLLLVILLSGKIEVGAVELTLSPLSLTVLRGHEARFTCAATSQWTVMVWTLNNLPLVTISRETGVLPIGNPNVTAERSSTSQRDSWMLVLKSVERNNHGEVTCALQGIAMKTASLHVQEKGNVRIFGRDKLAFRGQSVVFECAAAGWYPQPNLQWQVNGRKTSEGEYNISSEESEKSLFTVTSNLNVTAAVSSDVDCLASVSALLSPLKSSARLTVVAEVVQEEADCTVPLALTGSLSALLLLALLCVCTVLCYRQRRQSKAGPQEAIRFDPSVFAIGSGAQVMRGQVNLGYASEGPADAAYNEINVGTHSQMDFVSFLKVPDVVSSSSLSLTNEGQAQLSLSDESPKTVRRITTV
ncbi:immunoglobulin superfamily member 5-like [Salarias fasciatus]|uniref:immunoglobulin superfamily member 5-like n=1 Tax=Salarias fasciatus TaxID=181472 RepID=UPI001176EC64|nr:immunoglobulin superfamily member 5-like [Salarias fasciatus]